MSVLRALVLRSSTLLLELLDALRNGVLSHGFFCHAQPWQRSVLLALEVLLSLHVHLVTKIVDLFVKVHVETVDYCGLHIS